MKFAARALVVGFAAAGWAGCAVDGRVPAATGVPTTADGYAVALLAAANRVRSENELELLEPSECAATSAATRAKALLGADLTHAPLAPVVASCAPPSGIAAENLSRSATEPAAVVAAWLESQGHADNLLSPQLTQAGVGCVPDEKDGRSVWLCSLVLLG